MIVRILRNLVRNLNLGTQRRTRLRTASLKFKSIYASKQTHLRQAEQRTGAR